MGGILRMLTDDRMSEFKFPDARMRLGDRYLLLILENYSPTGTL